MIILTLEILLEALWESQRRKLNGTLIPECSGGGSGVFYFSMSAHKCVCWLTRPSRVCTSGRTPECHRAVLRWPIGVLSGGKLRDAGSSGSCTKETLEGLSFGVIPASRAQRPSLWLLRKIQFPLKKVISLKL